MTSEEHYDDSAFIYFALAVLAIILVPMTLSYVKKLRKATVSNYTGGCGCDACREKDHLLKTAARKPSSWSFMKFALYIGLILLFLFLIRRATTQTTTESAPAFDPYAILELDIGAGPEEIKKAHRRLSLKWHPDKNKAPEANDRFIEIAKAHKVLTDDDTREKWEKYGNPDGNQGFSVGIALPSFLVDTKNSMVVLAVYVGSLVIIFPTIAICYWTRQKELAHNQLNRKTVQYYVSLTEHMRFKKLITMMSLAYEYMVSIPLRRSDELILKKLIPLLPETEKQPKSTKEKPGKKPKMVIPPHGIKNSILYFTHFARLGNMLDEKMKQDTITLLDWSLQLVGCLAEIAAARRQTTPLIESIQISQMVVQAVWSESARIGKDTSLLQLPHFTESTVDHASNKKNKIFSIMQFLELNKDKQHEFLQSEGFSESQMMDVDYVASLLPSDVRFKTGYQVMDDEDNLGVTAGSVVTLTVEFTRPSRPGGVLQDDKPSAQPDPKTLIEAHCPYYPKEKMESWWIVMYDAANLLQAIKKVNVVKDQTEVNVPFMAPAKEGVYTYTIQLLCDSYVGFDKKDTIKIKVAKPIRQDKLPKIKATEDEDDDVETDDEEEEQPLVEQANNKKTLVMKKKKEEGVEKTESDSDFESDDD